jgi:Tol biopolymer transport system component
MFDLRARFRGADGIPAPDLWPDIVVREPKPARSESPWPKIGTAILALTVAAAASLVLVRAFRRETGPRPAVSPPPSTVATTPSPSEPAPKANGKVAFVRVDPATVQEGQPPKATMYVVEPDGTGIAKLIDLPPIRHMAWSPDGSKIAFGVPGGISVMNADGTGLESVTECGPPKCDGDASPDWSPNGTSIAFVRFDGFRDGLWVVNADGSDPRPLQTGFVSMNALAWSPDGREIAVVGFFGPGPTVGDDQIYLLSAETGELLGSVYGGQGRVIGSVAWSPSGGQLAFDSSGSDGSPEGAGIYIIGADGSGLTILTSCDISPPVVCNVSYPEWSPDGTAIAFTRGGSELGSDGVIGDLFVIDLASGEVRPLTSGTGLDCCASWQPLPVGGSSVLPSPSEDFEVGEFQCEPMRPFTDNVDLTGARCVSIPRPDGDELVVFLTPRGIALTVTFSTNDAKAAQVEIPAMPDLADATLSLADQGVIHVEWNDGRSVDIPTADW